MTTTESDEAVLVYGATGVQGEGILEQLLDDGHTVRAQTTSPERTDTLEQRGVNPVVATLDDHDALRAANESVSKVVLTTPSGYPSETVRLFGKNAIDAAERAAVDLFVLNTSAPIPDDESDVTYYEDRRFLERYLERSSLPFVSLRPTIYLENLVEPHAAEQIVNDGVVAFPAPSEMRAAWICVEDLGAFVAETLTHPEWSGRRIPIGGPEILTGTDIAEQFSAAMGRSIEYRQIPLDEFEAQLSETMGPDVGKMIPEMYQRVERHPDSGLYERDAAELRQLFPDIDLTSLKTWIERRDWQRFADSA